MQGKHSKTKNYLIWTGPRATDIIDCEEGLFNGSITLYGINDPDKYRKHYVGGKEVGKEVDIGGGCSSKASTIRSKFLEFDYSNEETIARRRDRNGRVYVPNICFCDSLFNLCEGKRIDHNRTDMSEEDLFILVEQLLLIH